MTSRWQRAATRASRRCGADNHASLMAVRANDTPHEPRHQMKSTSHPLGPGRRATSWCLAGRSAHFASAGLIKRDGEAWSPGTTGQLLQRLEAPEVKLPRTRLHSWRSGEVKRAQLGRQRGKSSSCVSDLRGAQKCRWIANGIAKRQVGRGSALQRSCHEWCVALAGAGRGPCRVR